MFRSVKGIIFDLDGVLTDTADFHYLAWKRITDELGVYFDRQINERLKGVDRITSLEIILEKHEIKYTPEEKMKIAEKKNSYYLELISRITPKDIFPGTIELFESIKASGAKIALGSASRNAREIIKRLGIGSYFNAIVDANIIMKGKPDPEIFLAAADMLGVKYKDCAVIEDSIAGIRAAKAAGMMAVGIGKPEQFPGADIIYSKTGEINMNEILMKGISDITVIHQPTGYDDPYFSGKIQRKPNIPLDGDNVAVNMVTKHSNISHSAYINLFVNKKQMPLIRMDIETSVNGENFWKAELGKFKAWDEVEYSFSVITDENQIITNIYHFRTGGWDGIGKVIYAAQCDNRFKVVFMSLSHSKKHPFIILHAIDSSRLKFTFGTKYKEEILNENENAVTEDIPIDDFKIQLLGWLKNTIEAQPDILNKICSIFNECSMEILRVENEKYEKVRYRLPLYANEKIYGMGERYSSLQFRGMEVDNFVYNQYRDQGLKTYLPVPFFMNTDGYGLLLDTAMYSIFRFGSGKLDFLEIETDFNEKNEGIDLYFFFGKPKEILSSYAKTAGEPQLPPAWAFGPWMSSNNWNSQEEVLRQVQLTKKHEIPASVIVIEQWSDESTFYIFNDAKYNIKPGDEYFKYEDFIFPEDGKWPDPKGMVQELHHDGLKVLLWQAPVQKYMHGVRHEQRDEDERTMLRKGYHVKHKNGNIYRIPYYEWFDGSLVPDFTNPDAVEWWLNKRLYLIEDIGIDGFKTDGGECIYGKSLQFYNGKTGAEMRNLYPYYYIKAYNEFIKKHAGDNDKITFSRSGYTGIQKLPLHWAGDEQSTFEAFQSSVRAGLNCGASGIPFWGWDLAGFDGEIPSPELYIRSTEMAVFCPVMQYHTAPGDLKKDRTPWNLAEQTGNGRLVEIYKKYADLRMNLLPYIINQAELSCRTGVPLMRAMFIEYPEDENCEELFQQYFFGDSLLAAPVMEANSFNKNIYLPDGMWMNLFSSQVEKGGRFFNVRTELDQIPVYVKENSVIPLNLSDDLELFSHVGNQTDKYANLCFMIFATSTVKYVFKDAYGNIVDINTSIESGNLLIDFESYSNYPIFLIIRNRLYMNFANDMGCNILQSENLKDSKCDAYTIRGGEILLKLYPGSKKIHFGRLH